jgi:hypothetical protein
MKGAGIMNPSDEENRLKQAFQHLPVHAPRPGYAQRFWARAEARPVLRPAWKWLPWGAVLAGLLLGLGLGQYRLSTPTPAGAGPRLSELLPAGSLAGQFAISQAKE